MTRYSACLPSNCTPPIGGVPPNRIVGTRASQRPFSVPFNGARGLLSADRGRLNALPLV